MFVAIFRTRAARHRVRGAMEGSSAGADAAAGLGGGSGANTADDTAGLDLQVFNAAEILQQMQSAGSGADTAAETEDFGAPAPPNTPAELLPSDDVDGAGGMPDSGSSANAASGQSNHDAAGVAAGRLARSLDADEQAAVEAMLQLTSSSADAAVKCNDGGSRSSMKCEYGTLKLPNDECYEGDIVKGMMHGNGRYTWPDGAEYKGEFHNDVMHGSGILRLANGECYTGGFRDDMPQGHGTHTWPDGGTYTGEFFKDMMHGSGVYTHADGRCYKGEFRDDKLHGQGTFTDHYKTLEGTWEYNLRHGVMECTMHSETGVSQSHVEVWERGQKPPRVRSGKHKNYGPRRSAE